jgi:protein-S-isoprenylcysteine O-methyltransferase Ste14
MNNKNSKQMTFEGASPIIFITTILLSIPIIILNYIFRPIFEISFISYTLVQIIAILLLCIGIPVYMYTLKIIVKGFNNHELITTGIFSLSRNPLFAEVIFFILPGIILFFNSWLLLLIPCFLYLMVKIFIYREEVLLERTFGQEYIEYKKNVPAVFPKLLRF